MTSTKHRNSLWTWRSSLLAVVVLALIASGCGASPDDSAEAAQTVPTTAAPAPSTTVAAVVATTTTTSTTTTEAPPETAAVEALLEGYYDAYNAGDHEAALALLSTVRELNPIYLEYWVGILGEKVESDCVESRKYPGGLKCIETYRDDLHGAAGEWSEAHYLYFEHDGLLKQLRDPDSFVFPGCKLSRCPGSHIAVDGPVPVWSYEAFELDLFAWLEQQHPDTAELVGDPGRLHYFVHDADAASVVMPFVEEFVAQSEDWGVPDAEGADLTAMTALEAVLAFYEVLNSHDAAQYEAHFGYPPDDPTLWFWVQGRRWDADCTETENEDEVRCELEVTDDFYTKAGAIFEYRELWTKSEGNLFWTTEWANSSDHWVYHDFEEDFGAWMREAYPDDAAIAFPTNDLVHNAEAALIAVAHLDEFLEWSDKYPRDPDPRNRWGD